MLPKARSDIHDSQIIWRSWISADFCGQPPLGGKQFFEEREVYVRSKPNDSFRDVLIVDDDPA